ncbi:hypothetical protein BT93_L0672 [Corymbia citriodora subsp. variegata]|uniref:Transcription and mRNA export factor SUS1 n=1 Tax=Corymbia citriodora subsp. variegata TaxID=360336 RepID=A0A8T0CEP6_CORYI|nr:hypothetical protein BT93_L0672 [Corymbia citriodora subsp. variegata]
MDAAASTQDAAEVATLVSSLHTRLVTSGEWNRLLKQLRRGLEGSQWDKDLQDYARGVSAQQEGVRAPRCLGITDASLVDTVPEELKDQLLNAIRAFVEKNVED